MSLKQYSSVIQAMRPNRHALFTRPSTPSTTATISEIAGNTHNCLLDPILLVLERYSTHHVVIISYNVVGRTRRLSTCQNVFSTCQTRRPQLGHLQSSAFKRNHHCFVFITFIYHLQPPGDTAPPRTMQVWYEPQDHYQGRRREAGHIARANNATIATSSSTP